MISQNGKLSISEEPPDLLVNFAFQAGPIIKPDIHLKVVNDGYSRRILLGETKLNELYFLAITQPNNHFAGPLLADVPEIIQQLNASTKLIAENSKIIQFDRLINLDGGTASVFY